MKNRMFVLILFSTLTTYAQQSGSPDSVLEFRHLTFKHNNNADVDVEKSTADSSASPDTVEPDHSGFGKEKAGTVCVNGLEKLEIAFSSDLSFLTICQLHFYAPGPLQGRIFTNALREPLEHRKYNKGSAVSLAASIDLTYKDFPVHLGYNLGAERLDHGPYTTYSGFGVTTYFSDIPAIHEIFHIARASVSYLNFTRHLTTYHAEDSAVHLGIKPELFVFLQLQPYHMTENIILFSEGFCRMREGGRSLIEVEGGFRHTSLEAISIGLKAEWKDFHYHSLSATLRFNISNPNPKHYARN